MDLSKKEVDELNNSIKALNSTMATMNNTVDKNKKQLSEISVEAKKTTKNTDELKTTLSDTNKVSGTLTKTVKETTKTFDEAGRPITKIIETIDKHNLTLTEQEKLIVSVKNKTEELNSANLTLTNSIEDNTEATKKAKDAEKEKLDTMFKGIDATLSVISSSTKAFDASKKLAEGTGDVAENVMDLGSNMLQATITGASFGASFGPWGAAIGGATGFLVSGIGALMGYADSIEGVKYTVLDYQAGLAALDKEHKTVESRLQSQKTIFDEISENALPSVLSSYSTLSGYIKENELGLTPDISYEEFAASLDGYFGTINSAVGNFNNEVYMSMSDIFSSSEALSSESEASILGNIKTSNENKMAEIKSHQDNIYALNEKAKGDLSNLSEEERKQYSEHLNKLNEIAMNTLTPEQARQKMELEKFNALKGNLTQEQSDRVIEILNAQYESEYDALLVKNGQNLAALEQARIDENMSEEEFLKLKNDLLETQYQAELDLKADNLNKLAEAQTGHSVQEIKDFQTNTAELARLQQKQQAAHRDGYMNALTAEEEANLKYLTGYMEQNADMIESSERFNSTVESLGDEYVGVMGKMASDGSINDFKMNYKKAFDESLESMDTFISQAKTKFDKTVLNMKVSIKSDGTPVIQHGVGSQVIKEVSMAADGGFAMTGQLFIAREAGPELVGRIGGKNAIANNDQIVASVSQGVAQAVSQTIGSGSSKGTINLYLPNGEKFASWIIDEIDRVSLTQGKSFKTI